MNRYYYMRSLWWRYCRIMRLKMIHDLETPLYSKYRVPEEQSRDD